MRLFTGIALPPDVRLNLERLISHLRPFAQLKWTAPYNLHITTKFIGEWPDERLGELKEVLAHVPRREAIPIELNGMGWFPNPHAPRIFWAAVKAPATLAQLAKETQQALLDSLQIPLDDKPFTPHLTLARVPHTVPLTKLQHAIAEMETVEFGRFDARSFHLFHSEPGPAGSIYTRLAEFALTPDAA